MASSQVIHGKVSKQPVDSHNHNCVKYSLRHKTPTKQPNKYF